MYRENWDTVTSAWWVKYPNPESSHVKEIHTVKRDISDDRFTMRRVFYLEYGLPAWIQRVFKITMEGWATEDVECSRKDRCLIATGRNITFNSFFQFQEEISYSEHPENSEWTLFNQRMQFRVLGFGILTNKLETAARDSAASRSASGLAVMDSVISKLKASDFGSRAEIWRAGKVESTSNEIMNKMSLYQTNDDFPFTSA